MEPASHDQHTSTRAHEANLKLVGSILEVDNLVDHIEHQHALLEVDQRPVEHRRIAVFDEHKIFSRVSERSEHEANTKRTRSEHEANTKRTQREPVRNTPRYGMTGGLSLDRIAR